LSEQIQAGTNSSASITAGGFNNLNQLTNLSGAGGPMLFAGSLNKFATVSVNSNAAFVSPHTTNFTGYANVTVGTNVVQITATDSYANSATTNYQIVVTNNGVAETLTYDLNGNEVSATTCCSTNTYEWDAADRLTAINSGANRSEFSYDGLGRRVQIVEKVGGSVVIATKFLWCGLELCEARDSTGSSVVKRFFGQGEQISGTNYWFTRDHLGSVRELTDASSSIRARYDYDPYGSRIKLSGDLDADFAFTGHYYHQPSGFHLALYRVYHPAVGRWLSRDPATEEGGLNLYAYVLNDPVSMWDPLGLGPKRRPCPEGYLSTWQTLKEVWKEKGSVDLTVSGGDVLGGEMRLSYDVKTGEVDAGFGLGFGLGFEWSFTGNLNSGEDKGWNVQAEVAGGGQVGGSMLAEESEAGSNFSFGGGYGVGAGGTVTVGYTWVVYDPTAPSAYHDPTLGQYSGGHANLTQTVPVPGK
jgi:RHS repeat-associated protein